MNATANNLSRRRGLSLFEVLIGLILTAMLLGAVAVSFNMTGAAVEDNDRFFRASQAARLAMDVIMLDIRCASNAGFSVGSSTLTLTANEYGTAVTKTYTYIPAAGTTAGYLELTANGVTNVLVPNVSACTFSHTTGGGNAQSGAFSSVSLTITVTINGDPVTMAGSAVPRANLLFQ